MAIITGKERSPRLSRCCAVHITNSDERIVFSAKIQGMQLSPRLGSNSRMDLRMRGECSLPKRHLVSGKQDSLVEQATDFTPFKVPVRGARRSRGSGGQPAVPSRVHTDFWSAGGCSTGFLSAVALGFSFAGSLLSQARAAQDWRPS